MSKRFLAFSLTLFVTLATLTFADDHKVHPPKLTAQNSGTTNGLIAVSPVNDRIVWASGRNGTFVKTTNGGKTTDFRIYKTTDGGATWTMQFQNQNPLAFYDCISFWTPRRGLSHSDSVNGVFPELRTRDGGRHWEDISANMPPALPGEASFAASNTCLAVQGERNAWIATGGSTSARILATTDGGNTWNAYDTPIVSSPSAGAFTVAFRNPYHGIVGGGDLDPTDPNNARTATSDDGGRTWTLTNAPPVTGAIFGLAYASGNRGDNQDEDGLQRTVVITANAGGAAWTPDEGKTWYSLPLTGYWAVAFASPKAGWLVGVNGTITKISF